MPSKTQFLFLFAALVAILLPSLLSDNPLEVIATLDQTRYIVISALGIAPSPIVDIFDTLFALYARLCGTLSSGPLDESRHRTLACWYDFLQVKHGQSQMRYLDPSRFAMYTSFCNGVEGGLQLPGAESRTPIPRAAVFLALAGTLALSFLPSPLTIATYGYRAILNSNFLTTFGTAFLANVVSAMTKVAHAIEEILKSFAKCIPAAYEVVTLFAVGFLSVALVMLTVVACWVFQVLEAASFWWRTGWRFASDDYSNPRGTQTPDFMPGICREPASVCRDLLRRFMVVEDVLDTERHQRADELVKTEKVRREQDAELGRLRQELAGRGRELSAAKEENRNLGHELRQSRVTINSQRTKLQSTRDNAKADSSSLRGEMDAERSQWDEEKLSLKAELDSANKKFAALEQELSVEKHSRAEETKRSQAAEQSAEGRFQTLRAEAVQKVEGLEQELAVEKSSRAEEHQRWSEVEKSGEDRLQALEAEARQMIEKLRQQLAVEQQTRASETWKANEAAQAAEKLTQDITARDEQIALLEDLVSKERQRRDAQQSERDDTVRTLESRIDKLEAEAAKPKEIPDIPMSDMLTQVLTYIEWEDNPFRENLEEYRLATELRGSLDDALPKEDPPCIQALKSTEGAKPPTVAGSSRSAGAPSGRPIKAFKRPSAKLAGAGR